MIGNGGLAQTLLRTTSSTRNLWVDPLLLGTGRRPFAGRTVPTALRLVHSTTFANGTMQVTYARAGKPAYGTM